MARKINTKISCINVVAHPHSNEIYIALFNKIFKNRADIQVGNQKKIIMGGLTPVVIDGENVLTGVLFKFLDIGDADAWYNIESNEEASDEDLREINIPKNLRPNLTKHRFVFYPKGHKLFIQVKGELRNDSISVYQVKKYLERICKRDFITEEFGEIFLTIEPSSEEVDQMLASETITEIYYEITLPNPDYDDEESYVNWMENQHIFKEKRTLTTNRGGHVEPDDELVSLAKTASQNGELRIKEKDPNGRIVTKTSNDSPLVKNVMFDPDIETATETFWNKTAEIWRNLLTRN